MDLSLKTLGAMGLGFFIPATVLSAVSVIGLPLLLITVPGIVISGILTLFG